MVLDTAGGDRCCGAVRGNVDECASVMGADLIEECRSGVGEDDMAVERRGQDCVCEL